MTSRPPTVTDAAGAGALLIAVLLICAAAGYGLGSLVGSPILVGVIGLLAGFILGIAVVHARYKGL